MSTGANINENTRNTGQIPVLPRGFNIRAFAQEIGVSHTTVYNVLNGVDGRMSNETRCMIIEKLHEAAQQPAPAGA